MRLNLNKSYEYAEKGMDLGKYWVDIKLEVPVNQLDVRQEKNLNWLLDLGMGDWKYTTNNQSH